MSSAKAKESKTAKGIFLGEFETTYDDAAWMDILDPVTDLETGARIKLASIDSAAYKKADKKIRQARLDRGMRTRQRKIQIKVDVLDAEGVELLAACTLDWENIFDENSEPLPCTPANAKGIYANPKLGYITEQVNEFIADRANFIKS